MKGFYSAIIVLASFTVSAQSVGDFQSFSSGQWNSTSAWSRWNGTTWVNPAPNTPNFNDGAITILAGHTITITSDITIDQVTVQGALTIDPNVGALTVHVTVNDGTGDDLTLEGPLTLLDDGFSEGASLAVNGAVKVNSGGSIVVIDPVLSVVSFGANSTYQHNIDGGIVPKATWNAASTCLITGVTATVPTGLSQTFGNFTWSCAGQSGGKFLGLTSSSSFNGSLNISNTNGAILALSQSGTATIVVQRDINISGSAQFGVTNTGNITLRVIRDFIHSSAGVSTLAGNGTANVEVKGNLALTGGTIRKSGSTGAATINISGVGVQNFTGGATITGAVNFTVSTGSTFNLGTDALGGGGTFTLQAGATIHVKSPDGLNTAVTAKGNIQTALRSYAAGGNIVYNSSAAAQNLGDEWSGGLSGIAVNLEIDNSFGVTNDIPISTSLVGRLTLTNGPFNIGQANTLVIQGDFAGYNGTTRLGSIAGDASLTSNLTFSGSGTISGSLNLVSGGETLNNLTISRSGTIVLATPLIVKGTLAFTGSGNLQFGGQTITVRGDITQSGSGGLISLNSASNLIIEGDGALTSIPFCTTCGTLNLNDVTLDRGTGTYTWNTAVRINGTFSLLQGDLTHSSGLTMVDGSTLARSAGTNFLGNSPSTTGSYNVSYNGNLTTGFELPSTSTALKNLAVAGDVTLTTGVTINGDVNINSGTLRASTFDVTMAGANFLVNGGAFEMDPAHTITFSRPGTTVLGGTNITGIHFGNLTINSGSTLSAPNSNINIAGTWDNLGTFTANTGSVTFDGGAQNIDANGQPFYDVTFAGSATKTLAGPLDANNSLTITSTLDAGANESINVGGSWVNNGTFIARAGTVTFDGGAQTINSSAQAFYNLELANNGTKLLGSALNVDGSLTIANGVTLDVNSSGLAVSVAGNWINNGTFNRRLGTVTFDGTTEISGTTATNFFNVTIAGSLTASSASSIVLGNWLVNSGTFNANGGTISFTGGPQSITPGGQPFNNVIFGGTNIKTLLGDIDINGNLTLNNSASTFSVGTNFNVNLAGNFDASGGGHFDAANGLFVFDGGAQTFTPPGQPFYNVAFSGSGTKTVTGALDVNGYVDINSALAAGANTLTVAGNWDATGGSFTSTGTTTFDGAAQTILSNGNSFGSVTTAGSGTKTLLDALDVNGALTVSSGLSTGTGSFPILVAGDWNTSAGTFTSGTGTVTLDGIAQNVALGAANSFNNLIIAGSGTKTQMDAMDVNGNLTINTGAELNAGANFDITLAGNITTNGAYTPGTGTLLLNGGGAQSLGGSTASNFNNITVNKASGTATVSTNQNLINTLTLTSGTLNANGMLTLVSNASGDARIAEITGGSITGGIIAQRYLPITATLPSGGVYRYFASPVTNAFVSDLKDDFPVTGTFNDPSTQAEWPGLNVTSSARIMFLYNESHTPSSTIEDRYESYPYTGTNSTAAPLENGRGYSARVRQTAPITLDFPGTPQTGDVPVNVTAQSAGGNDGWNMIGNPYPAPINWDNVTIPAGVNAQIALKDNANNSGIGEGQYVYYTQGSPGIGIPASYNGAIPSGQAFWVRATSNATITFHENDKQAIHSPSFMRTAPMGDIVRISVNGNNHQDELVVLFRETASDGADSQFDAFKLKNDYINFSSLSVDSTRMAINAMGALTCNKEVGLDLEGVTPGPYALNFSQFESFADNIRLRLLDNFTGKSIDISDDNSTYQFAVTDDPTSFGVKRFRLYVTYPEVETSLTVHTEDVCLGSNAAISIENSQQGVTYYMTSDGNSIGELMVSDGGRIELNVPHEKLHEGENSIVLMASIAGCSAVPLEAPVTVSTDKLYSITSSTDGKTCGAGQVALSAEGAPDNGFYKWYESVDSPAAIEGQNGNEFLTPVLEKTSTYYVSAVNALGCEGERHAVTAEVVYFDDVSITINEDKLTSSYEAGNQWYLNGEPITGATSQTIEVTETGLYEVEVTTPGGCSARTSQEMIVLSAEEPLGKGYEVYPNPVQNHLTIELPGKEQASGFIQSTTGVTVGKLNFINSGEGTKAEVDFEGEARGLYLVRIFQGNRILNYKIIKQ